MRGKYLHLRHLLLWRNLGMQWQPRAEFAFPERPLQLEIGFGNGEYLVRQAWLRPQENFLGLEIHWASVRRGLRRIAQAELQNVRLLLVDAHLAVRYLLPDHCADTFVALFPCPWPKRDQEHLRLFSLPFMSQLRRICRKGGLVVTDHEGLMEYARSQVKGSGLSLQVDQIEARYDTKYERRWSGEGQQWFYEMHYWPEAPGNHNKVAEVDVRSLTCTQFDPEAPLPGLFKDQLVVEFQHRVYDPKQQMALFLATVVEDHLTQTFWVEVAYSASRQLWVIRPAQGGGYLPTLGVQKALELVQQSGQVTEVG